MARHQRLAAALKSALPGSGPTAQEMVTRRRSLAPAPDFQPLPTPVGPPPYRRRLADVLAPEAMRAIDADGVLRFHCVGDTGGYRDPRPQRRLAAAMVAELGADPPPRFFYHLGDVVYPHGEEANYRPQFFSAYADYTAPIFAVPGNHDAEPGADAFTLEPFVRTFCSNAMPLHDAAEAQPRPLPVQPHVFWTLVHDWVWIVGLYSNVPEGGQLADDQLEWLVGELRAAPPDVTLVIAVHQPVLSADTTHGSNLSLLDLLEDCFERAARGADAVFTGHSHSYQRFARSGTGTGTGSGAGTAAASRSGDGRGVPYIVAGAGGYPELHRVGSGVNRLPAHFDGLDRVTLEAYEDTAHGFMTVTAEPTGAQVVYTAVGEDGRTRPIDRFGIR